MAAHISLPSFFHLHSARQVNGIWIIYVLCTQLFTRSKKGAHTHSHPTTYTGSYLLFMLGHVLYKMLIMYWFASLSIYTYHACMYVVYIWGAMPKLEMENRACAVCEIDRGWGIPPPFSTHPPTSPTPSTYKIRFFLCHREANVWLFLLVVNILWGHTRWRQWRHQQWQWRRQRWWCWYGCGVGWAGGLTGCLALHTSETRYFM